MVMVQDKKKSVRKWWSVCDSIWKVPYVGHLGESHGGGRLSPSKSRSISITINCNNEQVNKL